MYYHNFYTVDPFKPKSVEFDVWSEQEIRKLSVIRINSFITFDGLGYPVRGGLYDPHLGPLQFNSDPCATCGHNLKICSGHYGHIELPFPVFNPIFIPHIVNILKSSCLSCHKFLLADAEKSIYMAQLKLIDAGYLVQAHELDSYLEENMYKQACQIHGEMVKFCNDTISYSQVNNCKYAEDKWRFYVQKLLRQAHAAKLCVHCKKKVIKAKYQRGRLFLQQGKENTYLEPLTVRDHLRSVYNNDENLLKTLFKVLARSSEEYPTDLCFTNTVLVTPSNTRPLNIINQKPIEHPKNTMYRLILQDCHQIRSILQMMNESGSLETPNKELQELVTACKGDTINEKLHNAWHSLQIGVNSLLDADALKAMINTSVGISKTGLKQLLEKKAGILRQNMMGKRVDFFARSVVTPDPMININEIGVPEAFAKKLTFPVPVTPWNVKELRDAVLNGPLQYPGANIVEDDESVVWISGTNKQNRESLAKMLLTPRIDSSSPKVVHRHLVDGDMLLMNRQPSLHKPSIMAHKARVLKGEKTFRLHYANCKAYNADFDGDEVNAHFPQGELARAEASEIVNAAYQYLVPRDGTPLSGLIQDHVIASFRLTSRDKFFDRLQYNQFVFQAVGFLVKDIKTLPPAILKPKKLWSGKQVISTIIINLTPEGQVSLSMNSKTKLGYDAWPVAKTESDYMTLEERKYMSETNIIIRQGELLCGVLDKNHVGATHYGLVHSFYELYGGHYSASLLSAFSKLFTYYQQKEGFTLGVLDILVKKKPNKKRSKIAVRVGQSGLEIAKKTLDIPEEVDMDEKEIQNLLEIAYKKNSNFRGLIDSEYKSALDQYTNEINKVCTPFGLLQPFPANNLQLMVQSGAKGSTVNTMQISCLLGQIELEGKRPPLMISGKSLPSFKAYDTSPIAGGFIVSRFMTGIQPQEFFFHCMAGREGLIDTAVKTSRSGYLQRCLVKHLEGLVVNYDLTVRDSDNSVIQFQYGEDGLDILKSQLLKSDQMKFFSENIDAFVDKEEMNYLKKEIGSKKIKKRKSLITQRKAEDVRSLIKVPRDSGFLKFCRQVANEPPKVRVEKKLPSQSDAAAKLIHVWQNMIDEDTKNMYNESVKKCINPVVADYKPDAHFGAVTEKVESMIDDYIDENVENLPFKKSKFKDIVYWKTLKSLCQPGEAVGVLAAQSIGEPSTQMTLNTFHFAGRGEMNVTLGIPRLREILMVASKKIKTPTIEIPFKTNVSKLEKKAEALRKTLTRVVLKDVVEKVTVKESLQLKGRHIRMYELKLHYLSRQGYSNFTSLKPQHILTYVEKNFTAKLYTLLKRNLKSSYSGELILGQSSGGKLEKEDNDDEYEKERSTVMKTNIDSDDDSDADGDGDASENRRRNRQSDTMDYDDEDDNEEDTEIKDDLNSDDEMNDSAKKNIKGSEDEDSDDEEEDEDENNTIDLKEIIAGSSESPKVKKGAHVVEDFGIKNIKHDPDEKLWSKIVIWASLSYKRLDLSDLLPTLMSNAVIHEVKGIKRAITYVNEDGLLTLKAEGSYGIEEFFKYNQLLDLDKLYSNDIHAFARTYGIEAANRVIYREVQEVFKVYGITVDPRHLLLVADYMTFDGTFQPLNRNGMDNCPSPFQQMTFESTLKYLRNATVRKLKDNLKSPSSSLIVGQESKIGSGLISLYCK